MDFIYSKYQESPGTKVFSIFEIRKILSNYPIKIIQTSAEVENDELYGSIKPKEIANLIKEKSNADVGPSQIALKSELNKIGLYKVEINFHSEVKAIISIKIDKVQSK